MYSPNDTASAKTPMNKPLTGLFSFLYTTAYAIYF